MQCSQTLQLGGVFDQPLLRYSDDQPRDSHGRFGAGTALGETAKNEEQHNTAAAAHAGKAAELAKVDKATANLHEKAAEAHKVAASAHKNMLSEYLKGGGHTATQAEMAHYVKTGALPGSPAMKSELAQEASKAANKV